MSRGERLVSGEKPASNRVMTVAMSQSILQTPPALRPIVSASLCPSGGEEVGGRQQRGGPAPSSLLCPITAQLRREPLLLAVSVQTMSPSGAVGNITKCLRGLLLLLRVRLNPQNTFFKRIRRFIPSIEAIYFTNQKCEDKEKKTKK